MESLLNYSLEVLTQGPTWATSICRDFVKLFLLMRHSLVIKDAAQQLLGTRRCVANDERCEMRTNYYYCRMRRCVAHSSLTLKLGVLEWQHQHLLQIVLEFLGCECFLLGQNDLVYFSVFYCCTLVAFFSSKPIEIRKYKAFIRHICYTFQC